MTLLHELPDFADLVAVVARNEGVDPGLCLEFTCVGFGWRQRFLSALLRSEPRLLTGSSGNGFSVRSGFDEAGNKSCEGRSAFIHARRFKGSHVISAPFLRDNRPGISA